MVELGKPVDEEVLGGGESGGEVTGAPFCGWIGC